MNRRIGLLIAVAVSVTTLVYADFPEAKPKQNDSKELAEARSRLSNMERSGLGSKHPTVREQIQKIQALESGSHLGPRRAESENRLPSKTRFVSVAGGVRVPQRIPWSPDLTLLSAIELCGGAPWKDPRKVRITRAGERIEVTMQPIYKRQEPDPKLQPGDKIEVPE